jgi:hypothetical protein
VLNWPPAPASDILLLMAVHVLLLQHACQRAGALQQLQVPAAFVQFNLVLQSDM